jgi:hypothetical protein
LQAGFAHFLGVVAMVSPRCDRPGFLRQAGLDDFDARWRERDAANTDSDRALRVKLEDRSTQPSPNYA